ncbi:hypothetical protein FG379_001275 [Cryptosporidium bovis]|uniref:uncharacterized protein n=1 Tax=Cryptosporidium bovis TaxID=310047 RepID=UPI00351AAD85|nr:hypothetical protein FG379_001275 [Cryptosporidium bovis]
MGHICSKGNPGKDENRPHSPPVFTDKSVRERIIKPWRNLDDLTFQWKEIQVEDTHYKARYITPSMFYNLWSQSKSSNPFGNYGITFVDSQSFYYDVKVLEANSEEEEAMARLASKGALMKRTVIGAIQPFKSFTRKSTSLYECNSNILINNSNGNSHLDAIARYSKTINNWLLEQINDKIVVLFDHLWEGNASIRGDRVSHESKTFLEIMNCCNCKPEMIYILAGGFASLSPRYDCCIDENPLCSELSDNLLPVRFPCETIPLFPLLTSFCVLTGDIGILSQNNWDKYRDKFSISKIVNLTNNPEIFHFPNNAKIKYYSIPCYGTNNPNYWSAVNIIRQCHHFRKSVLLVDSSGDYHSMNIVALFLVEIGFRPTDVISFLKERKIGLVFDSYMIDLLNDIYSKYNSSEDRNNSTPYRPDIDFSSIRQIKNIEFENQVQILLNEIINQSSANSDANKGTYHDSTSNYNNLEENDNYKLFQCLRNTYILLENVLSFPNNQLYRVVHFDNSVFNQTVCQYKQGVELLKLAGFVIDEKDGNKKLRLPVESDLFKIKIILSNIQQEVSKHSIIQTLNVT